MTTTTTLALPGQLFLARVLTAKTPRPGQIRKDLDRFLPAPLGSDQFNALRDELVSAGLLNDAPLGLTASGRAAALEFLGLNELPPGTDWKTVQSRYLLPMALGVSPSPENRKQIGRADGLSALLLKKAYDLPPDSVNTLPKALEALACKLLGFPGEKSLNEVKQLILRDKIGVTEPLKPAELGKQLAAQAVSSVGTSMDRLREGVLRQWVGGATAEANHRAEPFDLPTFAATVQSAARRATEGRFGENKVFISRLWMELRNEPMFMGLYLDGFKSRLVEANREGLLKLSKADLPEALDPADVRGSETQHLGAVFHFVLVEKEKT